MTTNIQTSLTEQSYSTIPQVVIDRAVANGRRLRSRAIATLFSGAAGWIVATIKAGIGRRAKAHLGCGECGDMMRA